MVVNSVEFKKKHDIPVRQGLDLKEIAKLSKMPLKALQEVYNKGIGAFKSAGAKYGITSKEKWAMGRVYSFVMKRATTYYGADDSIRTKYKLK